MYKQLSFILIVFLSFHANAQEKPLLVNSGKVIAEGIRYQVGFGMY